MSWPFKQSLVSQEPLDGTAQDRRRLLHVQHAKLRRAEELQRRSSKVAASLEEENLVNHYIERLRMAYTEETPAHD